MQNPIVYAPAVNCSVSPLNVRKHSNAGADSELAANVGETGIILQNLIGVAVKRKKGHFSIIGGGRRLRAVLSQIEQGRLPEDFQVPVMVVANEKDAIELSLSENYYNLAMNPADACDAFRSMIETEGKTVEQVAKRLGLTKRFVEGRLRLANLAQPIFEALRSEEITLDVAMAYASTSDTSRQASVFERMQGSYQGNNIGEIRRLLAVGSYLGADPKAILVGRADYEAAGGRIEGDLFSNVETEIWRDGDILDRLVEEKLTLAAAKIRDRDGFGEVRVVPAAYVPYMETCQLERLEGETVPHTEESLERQAEILAEIGQIEELATKAGDYGEGEAERIEELQDELDALEETETVFSDEQRAAAIAFMVIGPDGTPCLHEALYMDREASEISEDSDDRDDDADEAIEPSRQPQGGDVKYSARLSDELAIMKTELLAVHVASDPHFALDLGTFIMVDKATGSAGCYDMPSELRAAAPNSRVADFASGTAAGETWAKLEAGLDRSWIEHKEIEQRYDAFCALDDTKRAAWFGWAVARTLQAAPDGSTGARFLNHLGAKLVIDVAAWWRPTARNFFDRISKSAILKFFGIVGGEDFAARYASARKFDLAASAEKLFAGEIIVDSEVKDRALAWLPDAMRFVHDPEQLELDIMAEVNAAERGVSSDKDGETEARSTNLSNAEDSEAECPEEGAREAA